VIADARPTHIGLVWLSLPRQLRWLFASDVFIRTCDPMVDVSFVLYAVNIIGISVPRFGFLVAVRAATVMVAYIPAARIAHRLGKKPFVTATFLMFALFPFVVVRSTVTRRADGPAPRRNRRLALVPGARPSCTA
jgi:hypothetical protein